VIDVRHASLREEEEEEKRINPRMMMRIYEVEECNNL
jgi:hypothetical protein